MQQNSEAGTSKISRTYSGEPGTSSREMSTARSQHPGARRLPLLSGVGIAGSVAGSAALVALHFVRPDVNDTDLISAYAVGPYGWLMVAAFLALGIGALAVAFGLRRAITPSRWSMVGSLLVGLFGVGFVLAGIFPVGGCRDVECVARFESDTNLPITAAAMAHGVGSLLGILLLIAGMFVLARAFKRDPRWKSFRRWSLVLGLAALLQFGFPGEGMVAVILMRTLVSTLIVWLLLAALRLRSIARESVA
ncbi:MAG TPA: DUF998 domain-containing protein [Herpetosiphonaceae bacterium]|nr:DUF998 domain-containing protein [Herpetosiphonaceae bacterium]